MTNMKNEVIERTCINCGRRFPIYPNAQDFFKSRGLELPKRCRVCREKKKQEQKAEEDVRQFEKKLSDSTYAIKEVSDIDVISPVSTVGLSLSRCHVDDVRMDMPPARKDVDIFPKRMENPYAVSFFLERYPHM